MNEHEARQAPTADARRAAPAERAPDPDPAMAMSDPADARLLRLLAPIHGRAQQSARRLARSNADGDDLFQEAVLRALARIGDLRDEAKFPAWFYSVLISVHRARCRIAFWRRFLPLPLREPVREPPPPGAVEDRRSGALRMASALQALPPEQREAVVLFEVDGFSIEEIAAMQASSVTAVKTRLVRGRQRLRRRYEELMAAEAAESGAGPSLPRTKEVSHV
ncbi:MAG: RNA polymerase sigma factor [Polyangia bacterium]